MGGITANKTIIGVPTEETIIDNELIKEEIITNYNLTIPELVLLLSIMKSSTFKGEQVELVYNTIIKLQGQYIQQNVKQ